MYHRFVVVAPEAYDGVVRVSEHDRRYMKRLGEFLREAESYEPASDEQREWARRLANEWRSKNGLPLLEEEDDDPPELGFFRRAKALGILDRDRCAP